MPLTCANTFCSELHHAQNGLAELDRMDSWNMPSRRRNAKILIEALQDLPEVKYLPIDTPERQNGWFVLAFSASCALGSVYGFLQGAWPFGLVEAVWSLVAARRWWRARS